MEKRNKLFYSILFYSIRNLSIQRNEKNAKAAAKESKFRRTKGKFNFSN